MAEEIRFDHDDISRPEGDGCFSPVEEKRDGSKSGVEEEGILVSAMEYSLQAAENTDRGGHQFLEASDFLIMDGIPETIENSAASVCFALGHHTAQERSAGNDCGLVIVMDTKTDQENVENSDYGPGKASDENIVGLREIGDHNFEQSLGGEVVAVTEYKEAGGDGDVGPLVLGEGSIMEIPKYSSKQSCDDNLLPKGCLSESENAVEAPHILPLVGEDSKTVVGVSEWPAAMGGDSDPFSLLQPQNLDAFPQSQVGFQEEKEEGDLRANHKEEPSANKLPVEQKPDLSAATQLDDDPQTSFGEYDASRENDVVEEKEDVARRDLHRATSKTCAVTERQKSSDSKPYAPGKAGTIHDSNENLNLDKEMMSTAAEEHEAISVGTNERIRLPKEKKINVKRRSSTSPSLQYTKKHRRRKSSHEISTTEILNYGNCPSEDKFSVGDLVWGKVRSHPWWPGQIYDPSDASEIASSYYHNNVQRFRNDRLLVAFFGDATFGWCEQIQLVPFQPNFAEKVKQTTAKPFKNAVMDALDELGRRVELGLTCFCEVKEARHVLESKAMLNAGIREGTVVNVHKDTVDAVNAFDPLKFLSAIQQFAKSPYMLRDLETSVACAQASAFLTFKGLLVSGKISLETTAIQVFSIDTQDSAELGLSPRGHASSSVKHKRKPEEKPPRRTKKRKINDLIAECEPSHKEEEDANGDDETLIEMAGRIKKRKLNNLLALYVSPDEEGDLNGHDLTLHDIAVTGSGGANAESTVIRKGARRGAAESKEASLPRRMSTLKTKKDQETESVASDILNNDIMALQSKKESNSTSSGVDPDAKKSLKTSKFGQCIRKVANELTAIPANSETVRNANSQKNGEHVEKSSTKGLPSTIKQAPGVIQESSSTRELLSELLMVAKNPLYWAKKKNMPSRLINSILQFRNAVFEKSSTNSDITKASILSFANEPDEPTCPQISTKLPGSSSISESKAIIHSTDRELSLRPTRHVRQTEMKRKAAFSLERAQKKKRTTKSPSSPWSGKKLKNELEDKTDDRCAKQYSRRAMVPQSSATSLKKFSTDGYGIQGPAALFMKFPKGFALPSEMELKAKFARFGSQEMSETKVFRRSGCAQVVFKTSASAEAAFNFASENKVFRSANVSFRLRYPSSGSRADKIPKKDCVKQKRSIQQEHRLSPSLRDKLREGDGHQENILQPSDSLARSTEKLGASRPNTYGEPPLLLIQQNLEMLTSMLSRSECTSTSATAASDNIPPDSKRDIMDEMMSLLQKVSALVSSPP